MLVSKDRWIWWYRWTTVSKTFCILFWKRIWYFLVKPEVQAKIANQTKHGRRLSVLMFYNDGLSHAMSRRVLNKTYYYLLNEHGGTPLTGYHTVAYSTFPNMIPYLTGIYCWHGDVYYSNIECILHWHVHKLITAWLIHGSVSGFVLTWDTNTNKTIIICRPVK